MTVKSFTYTFSPPFFLLLLMGAFTLIPQHQNLLEPAMKAQLPLGNIENTWFGKTKKPSQKEKETLAADTRFCKVIYTPTHHMSASSSRVSPVPILASVVTSGTDMNASIHRPERCLPAQGHTILNTQKKNIILNNGKSISFTRLHSVSYPNTLQGEGLHHCTYYLFIGCESIHSSHMERSLQDLYSRIILGRSHRWAYLQFNCYFASSLGLDEKGCDDALILLIQSIMPTLIKWQKIK